MLSALSFYHFNHLSCLKFVNSFIRYSQEIFLKDSTNHIPDLFMWHITEHFPNFQISLLKLFFFFSLVCLISNSK